MTEAQKGYAALVKHLRDRRVMDGIDQLDRTVHEICLWFIQNNLDSTEWWRELLSGQLDQVRRPLEQLISDNRSLRAEVDELKAQVSKMVQGGDRR